MINKIIEFSIKNKIVIGLLTIALIVWGIFSFNNLPINSIPDISSNQVRVMTVSPNLATQEVEQFITYPVEQEMANLPGVKEIRSVSKFGLSVVTVVFKDEKGTYLPRQLIKEKIKAAKDKIPDGLGEPRMGPIISGLGEIYQWVVTTKPGYDTAYSKTELRSIQDWIIKRQMAGIEGVVEINSWGGYLKQYEVAVNPDKLKSLDLTITDVYEALHQNNSNAGGSYIQKNTNAHYIRGKGLVKSLDDIRKTRIADNDGFPVFIKDVAKVQFGHATRLGAFTYNGKGEAVAGQAMMLKGENSWEVIQNVKERMEKVRKTLPEGVQVKPFIDRSELISKTSGTVSENLAIGGLIVIFILILLLGNWRSGLIVASVIPLSLLFAISMMNLFQINANLMSLGAMDFGIIVDGAVIIVEFVVYQLYVQRNTINNLKGLPRQEAIDNLAIDSSGRMMRTAFFGQVIILIVFIPILTLTGVEGKMFRPMALTFGFALIGAMILCLTYVPMMAALVLKPSGNSKADPSNKIMNGVKAVYFPILRVALKFRYLVLVGAIGLLIVAGFIFSRMGAVFMPQLDEGSIVVHPILQPGTSLDQTIKTVTQVENILLEEFPDEVEEASTRIGTGEVPADPMSLEMSDMFVTLAPEEQWTRAETKNDLIKQMKKEMQVIPGVSYAFSQPIEMLVSQFLTGVKADIAVKIFGDDLQILQEKGDEAEKLLNDVDGIQSMSVEKVTGLPQMVVDYNRKKMGEYGIDINQANNALTAAFSGKKAGTIYEGQRRFDMVVRLQEDHREDLKDIQNLYLENKTGEQVPMRSFADVTYETGPAQISRDQIQRRIVVSVNAGDRDVASLVNAIQEKLENDLNLPTGYNIDYGGDFENLQAARQRLLIVVPLALGLILVLLFITFKSIKQSLMVFTAIPLAWIGGVLALYLRGMPFSISAAVGFIALSGIAVLNGIVLISFFNELKRTGTQNIFKRILRGTEMRLRPVLLTASTDALGFLPMAVSASTGAEVQRPLATVVIGGLVTAFLLTMVVLPIIYSLLEGGWKKRLDSGNAPLAKTSLILISLVGLSPAWLSAQDREESSQMRSLTIDKAINTAMDNHPSLEAKDYAVSRQEALKKTTIDLGKTRIFTGKEEFDPETGQGVTTLFGINQTLQLPMVYNKENLLQKRQIRLAEQRLTQQRRELEKNVKAAYRKLQFGYAMEALYRTLDTAFANYQDAAEMRYETGEISNLEKLASSSQYQEIQVRLKEIHANLAVYHEELQQWLNTDDSLVLAERSLKPLEANFRLDTQAVKRNPGVQVNQKALQSAKANHERQKADLWPDLTLSYRSQEIRGKSGFIAYQIGLKVPLAFWSYTGRNEAAQLQVEQRKAHLAQYKNRVRADIRKQLEQYQQYQEQVQYYRNKRVPQANKLLDNANQQFQAGSINYPAYAQYVDQAIQIKEDYLKAVDQYNQAAIELGYLVGR